jgi:iron complex outermembrane receptor protein
MQMDKKAWLGMILVSMSTTTHAVDTKTTTEDNKNNATEVIAVYGSRIAGGSDNEKVIAPIEETPMSVTQFDLSRIEKQNIANVSDIVRYVAGGRDNNGAWEHSDGYSIRGFDQSSYIVWDGMLRNDPSWWAASSPFLLESIEVLKGPASVMYGQTAPGGVAVQRSKRASTSMTNQIELQLGTHNERMLNLDLGSELTQDGNILGRVASTYNTKDDQIDTVSFERKAILPTVLWEINETTDITFITLWQEDIDDTNSSLPAFHQNPNGKIPFHTYIGEPGLTDGYIINQYSTGYELNHAINDDIDFRQNFRRFRVSANSENNIWQNGFKNMNPPLPDGETDSREPVYDYRTIGRGVGSLFYRVDNWQIDNNIKAKFSHGQVDHTLMAGVEYNRLKQNSIGTWGGELAPLDLFKPVYGNTKITGTINTWQDNYSTDRAGAYIQDQIKIDEKYIVNASMRFDHAKTFDPTAAIKETTTDKAVTGRIGAMYLADNKISPYLSYAESFLPLVGKTFEGNAFVPEEGIQYEAGIKYGNKSDPLMLTFAVFDLTRQNVLTRHPTIDSEQVQEGAQQHQGVELETTFNLWDRLSATFSISHLKAEMTKSYEEDVKGKVPREVPENTVSVWLDYQTLFNPMLSFTFGASYESATFADPKNTLKQPGYSLFDAGVHYELENWRLSLTGSNLTDERYFTGCWDGNYCSRSQPRTVSASASYSF